MHKGFVICPLWHQAIEADVYQACIVWCVSQECTMHGPNWSPVLRVDKWSVSPAEGLLQTFIIRPIIRGHPIYKMTIKA